MDAVDLKVSSMDLALPVFGFVGIAGCVSDSVVANVGQALNIESTVATHVAIEMTAVNQLLLRKVHSLAFPQGP